MKKAVLIIIVFLLAQVLVPLAAIKIADLMAASQGAGAPDLTDTITFMGASVLIADVLIIALTLLILRGFGSMRDALRCFTLPFDYTSLALAVVTMVPLMTFTNILCEILPLPDLLQAEFEGLASSAVGILLVAVLGPLTEELVFRRGVTGCMLDAGYKKHWTILVSAAIFGIIHGNPAQVVGAFCFGLFFAWLYAETRSLWPSLVCHVLNNALGAWQLRVLPADMTMRSYVGDDTLYYLIFAASAVLTAVMLYVMRRRFTRVVRRA